MAQSPKITHFIQECSGVKINPYKTLIFFTHILCEMLVDFIQVGIQLYKMLFGLIQIEKQLYKNFLIEYKLENHLY